MTSKQSSEFWSVGDRLRGAGTPTHGEPYSIPTVNEQGQICTMRLVDIVMDGPRHYWATVADITPVAYQESREVTVENEPQFFTDAEIAAHKERTSNQEESADG